MTAIEWLVEQLKINNYISENAHWLIDEAKEMEKQQIIVAYHNGYSDAIQAKPKQYDPQKYYNETYKNQ
jgi:hypothetical protein